ncbi:MAG: type II and III secretion system protein family protein [Alphaproteobacteria bacterium]|nr:type II and III secretion system protein family protein [Alphaproteobacteria bacterium]
MAVLGNDAAVNAARIIKLSPSNRLARMQIAEGTSETYKITAPFSEVVVGDPEVADVNPMTDHTVYVLGKKLGLTNITVFDDQKKLIGVIDVEVTHDLTGLRQALHEALPSSNIKVRSINGRILLEGSVPSAPAAERAMSLAREFAGDDKMVSNSLSVEDNQQVNLEVRFVEVNRLAGKEFGINWNMTSNGNGFAQGTAIQGTGGIGTPGSGLGGLSAALPFANIVANILDNGISPDLLITALEQKRLARRLAEPNLTALSGESASFHAGGEFPIPVAQDNGKVTIEFKEFGVKLNFTPVVLDRGLINLKINPEVSEIDSANSVRLTQGGVLIPGLSVRRASTSVELRDGQSFAIAGLLQAVNAKTVDQVPWLGDVPILGTLFRSSAFQKRESDLVIIVTPRLARPVASLQQLHTPLDYVQSSNEPELFLDGQTEVQRRRMKDGKAVDIYGHIIDWPETQVKQ